MVREHGLEYEPRRTIYHFILKNPGLHFREISRKMNIPISTINYHLNYLKRLEILNAESEGRYLRYYASRKISSRDTKMINLLRKDIPLRIVMFLLLYPRSSQIKISRYLERHSTTIAFHLNKLIEQGIVENSPNGKEIHYKLSNQEEVYDLFTKYHESLLEDIADYDLLPVLHQ